MPNILLVPLQMFMKLTQNPSKEISTCVAKIMPTNLRKSVKLLYIYNNIIEGLTCSALNKFVGK